MPPKRKRQYLSGPDCKLPDDIIEEILSRLPVKSILRFKCVSKSWFSLFSKPKFITNNCRRTALDSNHQKLITCQGREVRLFDVNSVEAPARQKMLSCRTSIIGMVGTCNGLVCLSCPPYGEKIVIWNPAINKYKATIKSLGNQRSQLFYTTYDINSSKPKSWNKSYSFGFGLDTGEGNFITLRILNLSTKNIFPGINPVPIELRVEVEIYFTKSDSWKKLEVAIPFNVLDYANCAIVRGVPYFRAIVKSADDKEFQQILVSFDVEDETFNHLHLPDIFPKEGSHIAFGELNNSLALLVSHSDVERIQTIDVWVLDENKFWSQKFSVGPILTQIGRPIGCLTNGTIFLADNSRSLFALNPKSKEVKCIQINNSGYSIDVHNYTASLVSINGMIEFKRTLRDPRR